MKYSIAIALASLTLLSSPAGAKFYIGNRTNYPLQIATLTANGARIDGNGWYRLNPGEEMTVHGNDYRRSKTYWLVIRDGTGRALEFASGNLCGRRGCFASYGPVDALIPSQRYSFSFKNDFVADRIRGNSWEAFQNFVSGAVVYRALKIQATSNCWDSGMVYITNPDGGAIDGRVWDPARPGIACGG